MAGTPCLLQSLQVGLWENGQKSMKGSRNWSMAVNNGSNDFMVLSNGSIANGATNPVPLTSWEGDLAAWQPDSQEALRTKVSPNGCLQVNGTVKPSLLPLDNQRVPQMLPQCRHPCPCRHPLPSHGRYQESVPDTSLAVPLASCCVQPPPEHCAALRPSCSPVYQTACCLQTSPPFCLHHPWPSHSQPQPVQQLTASVRPSRPFKLPKRVNPVIRWLRIYEYI
ncbi:protein dispatched homolog 1-like [Manis pentadactyla]|uniref:protein dispatched homolog 1-like n=1 Tax=Manis pentadactyla TaxID=143292 RepID=UPI00255C6EB8|nr:protein dispatched homolog 1-like [Manis pentadactyla]